MDLFLLKTVNEVEELDEDGVDGSSKTVVFWLSDVKFSNSGSLGFICFKK